MVTSPAASEGPAFVHGELELDLSSGRDGGRGVGFRDAQVCGWGVTVMVAAAVLSAGSSPAVLVLREAVLVMVEAVTAEPIRAWIRIW